MEIEGYQSDIKLLRGKLSQLETKLLAVAEVSDKGEEHREILETLRWELLAAEKRKPKQWICVLISLLKSFLYMKR